MTYYKLQCTWIDEDGKHSCVDTWNDLNENDTLKHVIEYLDIMHHDYIPFMPEMDQIRKNFNMFGEVDEQTVQNEYKRLIAGYKAFMKILSELDKSKSHNSAYAFSVCVDEYMTINITATNYEV